MRTEQKSRRPVVLIVLGYRQDGPHGEHLISPVAKAAVGKAEKLAKRLNADAVLFTGGSSTGGPSEAEQMRALWKGPANVKVLVEGKARMTSENATKSLALIEAMNPGSVVVVSGAHHMLRVPFFFGRLFRKKGIDVRYEPVLRPLASPKVFWLEVGGVRRMSADRRGAEPKKW